MITIKIGDLRDKRLTDKINSAGLVQVQHYNDTAFYIVSQKKMATLLDKAKKSK